MNSFMKLFYFFACKLTGTKLKKTRRIVHIVEGAEWVIKRIGGYIARGACVAGMDFILDVSSRFYVNSLIHFGSLHVFSGNIDNFTHPSNKLIVTIFHGNWGISPEMDKSLNKLITSSGRISRIVVPNVIMKRRLISWGIPEEKIAFIPIGVELKCFMPFSSEKKKTLRSRFGIPADAICIGSFQKDGVGWGEGLEPKLIKGPDIFIKAVRLLSEKMKIYCLLTGPARGYIKKNLNLSGIPYTYLYAENYSEMADFYNCLDLYLVTSREEGGPEAIMESMATGVPLVSTCVGMAPDLIRNKENGLLVGVDDAESIAEGAKAIMCNADLRSTLIQNGLETVKNYDWDIIADKYALVYQEVLTK